MFIAFWNTPVFFLMLFFHVDSPVPAGVEFCESLCGIGEADGETPGDICAVIIGFGGLLGTGGGGGEKCTSAAGCWSPKLLLFTWMAAEGVVAEVLLSSEGKSLL